MRSQPKLWRAVLHLIRDALVDPAFEDRFFGSIMVDCLRADQSIALGDMEHFTELVEAQRGAMRHVRKCLISSSGTGGAAPATPPHFIFPFHLYPFTTSVLSTGWSPPFPVRTLGQRALEAKRLSVTGLEGFKHLTSPTSLKPKAHFLLGSITLCLLTTSRPDTSSGPIAGEVAKLVHSLHLGAGSFREFDYYFVAALDSAIRHHETKLTIIHLKILLPWVTPLPLS